MKILTKKTFNELSEIKHDPCISIYIPTHRDSKGNRAHEDKTNLKNQLKEARVLLMEQKGWDKEIAEDYLKQGYRLLEDDLFWKYQSDGLAAFLYNGQIDTYTLPVSFAPFTYLSDHLYLLPLVSLLNNRGRFFILVLGMNHIQFYEGTKHSIADVRIADIAPQSIKEALGEDYEQQMLQSRAGHSHHGGEGMFHGHGLGTQKEKKEEIEKFFNQLDNGLMNMLHDEKIPLVLAGVNYLIPMYKKVSQYQYITDDHISGNHEQTDMLALQRLAWEVVAPHFEKAKETQIEQYKNLKHTDKATASIYEVIPAAIAGRVETLFIKADQQLWGNYIEEKHTIEISDEKNEQNVGLLNLAAVHTIKNDGQVYMIEEDDQILTDNKVVGAEFRYAIS
ncbi:MAG: hypothetical protein ACFB0B_14685 [Thermonemataceae bacterium]